jgi:hypothetical protein
LHRLAAEEGDFARRVFSFERHQIRPGDGELEAASFALALMLRLVKAAARSSTMI